MIGQRDAVGLATFDTAVRIDDSAAVVAGPFFGHLPGLEETKTGGRRRIGRDSARTRRQDSRRGLVIILSDGFDELDDLVSALRHLRHRHHEVLFFHILAPEEEEFPFRSPMQLRNLERPDHRLRVDPLSLRAAYLERFSGFCRSLKEHVRAMGADYHRASTGEPVEKTLLDYLSRRSRRGG